MRMELAITLKLVLMVWWLKTVVNERHVRVKRFTPLSVLILRIDLLKHVYAAGKQQWHMPVIKLLNGWPR